MERKYGTIPGLNESVETQLIQSSKDKLLEVEDYSELEKASAGGGIICQFKWEDKQVVEMGMLVLKNDSIVKRDVWVTDIRSEQKK